MSDLPPNPPPWPPNPPPWPPMPPAPPALPPGMPPYPPLPPFVPPVPLGYAAAGWRKLHPATIVVSAVAVVKSMAWVIAVVLALRFFGRGGGLFEVMLAGFGALQVVGAVLRYASVKYTIEHAPAGDALVVQTGIIFRQRRAVPVARIQNINVKRDIVQRLLGVAELKIETAAGAAAEVDLSVLGLADAEALRTDLLNRQRASAPATISDAALAAGPAEPVAPPANAILYAATVRDLLIAGATSTRVGAVVGGVLGTAYFIGDLLRDSDDVSLPKLARDQIRTLQVSLITAIEIGLGILLLALLAGWLLSIGTSLVVHWGFRLELSPAGKFVRRFGLFTLHESDFPRHRLQQLTLTSGLFQRRFDLWQLRARTAGSYIERESGGSSVVCPVATLATADRLAVQLVGGSTAPSPSPDPAPLLVRTDWLHVSRRAITRWTVRNGTLCAMLLAAVVALSGQVLFLWLALLIPVLAYLLARLEFRVTAYVVTPVAVVVRSGVLTRRFVILPRDRVQLTRVTRSPIQRLRGLATLKLISAAGGLSADATVPHLPVDTANALQDRLTGRIPPDAA